MPLFRRRLREKSVKKKFDDVVKESRTNEQIRKHVLITLTAHALAERYKKISPREGEMILDMLKGRKGTPRIVFQIVPGSRVKTKKEEKGIITEGLTTTFYDPRTRKAFGHLITIPQNLFFKKTKGRKELDLKLEKVNVVVHELLGHAAKVKVGSEKIKAARFNEELKARITEVRMAQELGIFTPKQLDAMIMRDPFLRVLRAQLQKEKQRLKRKARLSPFEKREMEIMERMKERKKFEAHPELYGP